MLTRDQIQTVDLDLVKDLSHEVATIRSFLNEEKIDLLVIDNYEIEASWEQNFNLPGLKILVIDDLHNRKHFCHYLLDQNVLMGNPYEKLVQKGTQLLLGPSYCLINPKFHSEVGRQFRPPFKILVFFGGMDHVGATLKFLPTFLQVSQYQTVTIVAGAANPKLSEIREGLKGSSIQLEVQLPDLHSFMQSHDLFIGAGGVTTWERCAMGLPSIILSIAENQEDIALQLASQKIQTYMGRYSEVTNSELLQIINLHLNDFSTLEIYSRNSLRLVPKSGINNVVEAIEF